MGLLNEADSQILPLALRVNGRFDLFCEWYLRGFKPMPWQYAWHQPLVVNKTAVTGIATGKTTVEAASQFCDAMTIPYLRGLNTSITAKQAELAFEKIWGWIDGNERVEHLIDNISLRPYPMIKFKNYSELEFRTSGTDARFIRGQEFDRINFDEAGLDFTGEIVRVLRGRLRGTRPNGLGLYVPRQAILSVTTSPTDAPWLIARFDKGWKGSGTEDLKQYLSFRVSTYQNIHLTAEQIAAMEAEYPDELVLVEMGGNFPDYGMSEFPKKHVEACTHQELLDKAYIGLGLDGESKPKPGYVVEEHPRHGITKFELPYDPLHRYIMAGDPGQGDPPYRNAGVVAVLDVQERPYRLVYFDWVSGHGSYRPFLSSYKYALSKYNPELKGLDTTGTQKMMQELAFDDYGIETDGINFGSTKDGMVNALSLLVSNHDIAWPSIRGITRQMLTYKRSDDRDLAQDVVMTLGMLAFLSHYVQPETIVRAEKPHPVYRNRRQRTGVRRRR